MLSVCCAAALCSLLIVGCQGKGYVTLSTIWGRSVGILELILWLALHLKDAEMPRETPEPSPPATTSAPAAVTAPAPPVAAGSIWDALAACESGGNWNEGDGGLGSFRGGLQFHPQTWRTYRHPGMPEDPALATREQEILVAQKVQREQGWGAWPSCSRRLGLR